MMDGVSFSSSYIHSVMPQLAIPAAEAELPAGLIKTRARPNELVRTKAGHLGIVRTKARPFECSTCTKSFASKSDLDRHEKVRNAETIF